MPFLASSRGPRASLVFQVPVYRTAEISPGPVFHMGNRSRLSFRTSSSAREVSGWGRRERLKRLGEQEPVETDRGHVWKSLLCRGISTRNQAGAGSLEIHRSFSLVTGRTHPRKGAGWSLLPQHVLTLTPLSFELLPTLLTSDLLSNWGGLLEFVPP